MKPEPGIIHQRRRRQRSSSSSRAGVLPAPQAFLSEADASVVARLIISGWVITLFYIPSGLLHALVGDLVYFRDLALGLHLLVSIGVLIKIRQFGWVAKRGWFILLTPILLLPAVANHLYTYEALRTSKWSFAWLDWIILGHFVRLDQRWRDEFRLLVWITLTMMALELAAGSYDWVTSRHLIEQSWADKTAFGVSTMFDETIGGHIRVRGLQRDVFSFADIMALNAVGGMAYLIFARTARNQLRAMFWVFAFGSLMFLSGARAAMFGVVAAFLYTVGVFTMPAFTRRFERRYVLFWVAAAITLSLVGVGKFTDFIGNNLLGGLYMGDSESAFMRDNYWSQMLADFVHTPLILLFGGPSASVSNPQVDPMFHWVDNQFLWNTYHLGLIAAVAFAYPFWKVLRTTPQDHHQKMVRSALILFLLFAIGEGIARESLVMIGCMPLFVFCGYEGASEMLARHTSTSRAASHTRRNASEGRIEAV